MGVGANRRLAREARAGQTVEAVVWMTIFGAGRKQDRAGRTSEWGEWEARRREGQHLGHVAETGPDWNRSS